MIIKKKGGRKCEKGNCEINKKDHIISSLFFIISSAASLKLRQKTHLKNEVTAKKRTSYGRKTDKLRQKTGQVTEKSQEVMEKKSGLILKLRKKSRQVMAKK